jgi:pimeloyl-ACP methyl ester carboxylesterase
VKNNLGIHPVAGTEKANRKLDVLFIHGLGGDAFSTWQYEEKDEYFWPKGLVGDFPEIGVWTIAYGATPSRWIEDVMAMEDRAENLLNQFVANGIGKRPFTLVAHSMGGLIAKYIITQAEISNDPDYQEIANNCRGVVFLAVPHTGSGWSNLLGYANVLVRGNQILKQLAKDDSSLRRLDDHFSQLSKRKKLMSYAFIETKEIRSRSKVLGFIPIPKGIKIVSETSAGATELAKRPVPMDDDHLSICKLTSKEDQLYKNMAMIIKSYLDEPPEKDDSVKKKTEEEVRSHRHWLYHTMAHDYFSHNSVTECFQNQNYFVGFYAGERNDMPYSFAVDYYTKLKMPLLSDEVWDQILDIELDGAGEDSFRNGLYRKLLPKDYLQLEVVTSDGAVISRVKSDRWLVFYVQIDRARANKAASIINGAIAYLKGLDIQDSHLAVLFNYKEVAEKLPSACNEMNSLRKLQPDDIEDWIVSVEKKDIDVSKLEAELAQFNDKSHFTYKDALQHLETLPPAEVLKGKYS